MKRFPQVASQGMDLRALVGIFGLAGRATSFLQFCPPAAIRGRAGGTKNTF